jgi:hypothetical protein
MPAGLGEFAQHSLPLRGQSRREDGRREESQPASLPQPQLLPRTRQLRQERIPVADLPLPANDLRAVRIIQTEHGGLDEDIRRPQTRRVPFVALDFRRPAVVTFHEHAHAAARHRQRGGVIQWWSARRMLRSLDSGDDGFRRLPYTPGRPRHRQRRRHQPQELPPARFIGGPL